MEMEPGQGFHPLALLKGLDLNPVNISEEVRGHKHFCLGHTYPREG